MYFAAKLHLPACAGWRLMPQKQYKVYPTLCFCTLTFLRLPGSFLRHSQRGQGRFSASATPKKDKILNED
ncbi:hypothetical protein DN619_10035 [Klebsiella michiganensis]|nr:hypothetical protein DN619_10035 [Klebsiella michiganensis]